MLELIQAHDREKFKVNRNDQKRYSEQKEISIDVSLKGKYGLQKRENSVKRLVMIIKSQS